MTGKGKRAAYLLGAVCSTYLGLLFSPYLKEGLPGLLKGGEIHPLSLSLNSDSLRSVLLWNLLWLAFFAVWMGQRQNFRYGEEHGSARWGDIRELEKRYADKRKDKGIILTEHISISSDTKKHRRNLNVLVCGGSGAGKTRFYAKPNLMLANEFSYVVLDPKGELLRDTGILLRERGYRVKILDLINMEKSDCYNPFVYLKNDNDIQRMVTNLFANTTPKDSKSSDPFWDQAGMMLLLALVFYLHYEFPAEEQNFSKVLDLIRLGDVDEENSSHQSKLDMLFNELERVNPEHTALKYYRNYRSGAGKTLKSIQITLLARLEKFNLSTLSAITRYDEMDLNSLGEEKTALFAIIPDNDTSFNFIVGMLYTQLFQQLYYQADIVHGGSLPVPVHFIMDEFANADLVF